MYSLYIDTHFTDLVLALLNENGIVDKKVMLSNKHSEYTINLLNDLLNDNNIDFNDIKEVIVINGPGSFTGVRIGIVIAKIIGYTKNISIKTLSYLEALSLKYDNEVIVGLKDKNGVFIGEFNGKHELLRDYYYLSNSEFLKLNKEVIIEDDIDLFAIYNYMKAEDAINPHLVTPLYVKKIEVQK